MTDREAMQQALDALDSGVDVQMERVVWTEYDSELVEQAITALRERLAQPEHCQCPECQVVLHASDCAVHNEPAYPKGECNCGAQPEQEPVAWLYEAGNDRTLHWYKPTLYGTPLYTTPPQRKPLTEEEIEDEWERITGHSIFGGNRAEGRTMYISPDEVIEFARAIEANLKEKNT